MLCLTDWEGFRFQMQKDIVKWKYRHDTAPFPSLNLLLKVENVELPAVKMLMLGGGGQEQQTVKFGRCMAGDLSKHRWCVAQMTLILKIWVMAFHHLLAIESNRHSPAFFA
jgi:hypothetical protein